MGEKRSHSEKLRDPRWQKKRLEILSRDKFMCVVCGSIEKTLNVHHLRYTTADPWLELPSNLRTVCEICHERLHDKEGLGQAKDAVLELMNRSPLGVMFILVSAENEHNRQAKVKESL